MPILDVFIRILVAAVLGGVIGIEREIREHTAGFRTHILVSVGSAAFTLASSYGLEGTSFDPNRIAAQVVVKEMSVEPGEDASDTIHLFLKLPRGLNAAKLTALIADLKEVQTVSVD